MTALAVETAAACLGIGVCGYLIGRMHAPKDRRPGYVTIPPAVRVDNWAGHPYDQQAARTDEVMLQTTVAGMEAVRKASEA